MRAHGWLTRARQRNSRSRRHLGSPDNGLSENAYLGGFFLKLLDGSFVNSSAFVDQMTSGGGLAGVDVANDHDVDVDLFLSHFRSASFCDESDTR